VATKRKRIIAIANNFFSSTQYNDSATLLRNPLRKPALTCPVLLAMDRGRDLLGLEFCGQGMTKNFAGRWGWAVHDGLCIKGLNEV
jgi:hypothetical protein